MLKLLLGNGYSPVLTIPIVDEKGFAIKPENDDVVVRIAKTLEIETVVQLIEALGFMENPEDENSLVKRISLNDLKQ